MKQDPTIPVYFRKHDFLTTSEKKVFSVLLDAMPDYHVFPQVAMSALVTCRKGVDIARDKIAQKYVDFVVMDNAFNVIAVLELDDPTHERPERRKADAEKDYALKTAGIRIVRIKNGTVQAATVRKLVVLTKQQWNTPTRHKTAQVQSSP